MTDQLPQKLILNIGPSAQSPTPIIPQVPQELRMVPQDHPALHRPCEMINVGYLYRTQNESLVKCMLEVCDAMKGYGLSANQLGLSQRLFVMYIDQQRDFAFFNPELLAQSEETTEMEEGCLSLPYILHKVKRPTWVILKYQDINGTVKQDTFHSITARVICHEMDHMNGLTLFDHMTPFEKRRAKERQAKLMKKAIRRK